MSVTGQAKRPARESRYYVDVQHKVQLSSTHHKYCYDEVLGRARVGGRAFAIPLLSHHIEHFLKEKCPEYYCTAPVAGFYGPQILRLEKHWHCRRQIMDFVISRARGNHSKVDEYQQQLSLRKDRTSRSDGNAYRKRDNNESEKRK
ncbi:hypothetical protein CC1G_10768 [Coprinopsis cinerea okayama7|uniref:Uncharacterized protein n=1 Tax=Coprinopsis cinerea (strain Okayama-7 / 130 / ATCC MYA-4618 / FGSC 9003) TaxID=240176 RepID=A8P3D4_COPC7|nr:hypothetical protein CC1G_10768 [Coprinopsis cinerea okayama7\|eukprot:XP_001838526.2 hypothetical protein CC1G_10768 [Coprinopsis cinerea okayama7\